MDTKNTAKINGMDIELNGERNLLELCHKAGIDIPTFCYHSELSIYGACRLCLVEVEGMGIMASCSTVPSPGMVIHTDTKAVREIRRINVELLLANHKRECPTCARSSNCTLQALARRLGVEEIRFKQRESFAPLDKSSPSLTRDPNKCVLCGDCVRVCKEVQGIGAIDFAFRGAKSKVAPAFDKNLGDVECVNCGQCAAVCPTGAIIPRQDSEKVWDAIHDKNKTVVVQIAPAVRVAIGEHFGMEPGGNHAGLLVSALKMMGFDQIYDTSFTADMTIFEEATEFIGRLTKGEKLPLFTSCCPGWVKFAELNFPDLIPNLSTCKSPQQMFGSVAREVLPKQLGVKNENLVIISIMPCTAKKYEASLPKFSKDGQQDVDYVLTTSEIGRMINSMGIRFKDLEPSAFDMPLGFATGAGVIFGATGGVMEAALRYAYEKLENKKLENIEFKAVRGMNKLKEATVTIAGTDVKVAVVYTLGEARKLANRILKKEADYHFIEVMACPGGCISGGGQPIIHDDGVREKRAKGLYKTDRTMQFQKSQDNYLVEQCYKETLGGGPGSHKAHETLHTKYKNRSQIFDARIPVLRGTLQNRLLVAVTVSADEKKALGEQLLGDIVKYIKDSHFDDRVDVDAAFSSKKGKKGSLCVSVGDEVLNNCDLENIKKAIADSIKMVYTNK